MSIIFECMSRSLRIEYPDAWYHVMNRGARKMNIFHEVEERKMFLELLEQIHNRYQVEIHAYCLMDNHYHLLLKTPLANLSRAMQHLNGIYVQRYNKMHKTDGPLFRGRFKSIVIDAENYLLRLSRYIHLNPVQGGLINRAENYLWSSCADYLNYHKKHQWLQTKSILDKFGNKLQKQKYRIFLEEHDKELDTFFNKIKCMPILGAEAFIKTITEKYLSNKPLLPEVSEQRLLYKNQSPTIEQIISKVIQYYQIDTAHLKESIRGKFNKPRSVAIYLARTLTDQNLQTIADTFGNITYSNVSRIVKNTYLRTIKDSALSKEIDQIKNLVSNSQLKI